MHGDGNCKLQVSPLSGFAIGISSGAVPVVKLHGISFPNGYALLYLAYMKIYRPSSLCATDSSNHSFSRSLQDQHVPKSCGG